MVAEKGVKRGAYKEADQHEKAYQVQKGVFMFGKTASRKEGSNRAKHVREKKLRGGREGGREGGWAEGQRHAATRLADAVVLG
jgi:hypothetical protein